MRRLIPLVMCVVAAALPAGAQDKSACDLLTDAEVAELFGKTPAQRRSILGADNDCHWTVPGYSFSVMRVVDEPETATMMVDAALKNVRQGDTAREEPGIGQRAASTVSWTGRGVSIVAANGGTAWTLVLDRVDQKIDVTTILPKMRALAKKVAGGA